MDESHHDAARHCLRRRPQERAAPHRLLPRLVARRAEGSGRDGQDQDPHRRGTDAPRHHTRRDHLFLRPERQSQRDLRGPWVPGAAQPPADDLDIERADLVGNSFGGALGMALTIRHPQRVRRLVLVGSVGVPFAITPGLDAVWGYTPSFQVMRGLLDLFAYDRGLVNDELAQLRFEASIRPGFQESFSAMFPAPRQRWVDAMRSPEADIRRIAHETLVIHGREDQVIPLANSLTLAQWIARAQLHVYPRCGHWTQIEHAARFAQLVGHFLAEAGADEPRPLDA